MNNNNTLIRFCSLTIVTIIMISCGGKSDKYDASGNFEAEEIIISSEASGKILQLNITEGATLKAGQVIGYIDTAQLYLKKKQLGYSVGAILAGRPDAASQLSTIEKQIETARYERSRIENLLKDDAATRKQLDDANAQIDLLQKQYNSLKVSLGISTGSLKSQTLPVWAQIEQLEDQIKKSIIINPIDGTVLTKYAEKNEVVTPGKAIYKVADVSTLILRIYISGNQLSSMKLGQKINVFVDADKDDTKKYEGVVSWVSDKAEFTPKTIQTKDERANLVYAVKVNVKNDGFLKIGMYADVLFEANASK